MALTVTVTRSYTALPGVPITADDFNAGFTPSVEIEGLVGSSDLQDGAIRLRHLYASFLAEGQAITSLAADDLLLVGTAGGTANRTISGANLLNGLWSTPALHAELADWSADRFLYQIEDGTLRAIAPSGLASELVRKAPVATTLSSYSTNLVPVNQPSGATALKVADFAKALIAQAPAFVSPATLANADQLLVVGSASGLATKTTVGELLARHRFVSSLITLPAYQTSITPVPHGLGARPSQIEIWLVCQTAMYGYQVGQIIPGSSIVLQDSQDRSAPAFPVWADATNLYLHNPAASEANFRMVDIATNTYADTVPISGWKALLVASL